MSTDTVTRPATAYTLTLGVLADSSDPRGVRRVRRLLKCMVRSLHLRCVTIEPIVCDDEDNVPHSRKGEK
jgi:hypothetical protein